MRWIALALVVALPALAQETTTQKSGSDLIDHHVKAKWQEVGLSPSKPCDDAEFMRRAWLDIAGTIPSLEEAEKFLADRSSDKRAKLVERLLVSEEYASFWSEMWALIMVGGDSDNRDGQVRRQVAKDLAPILARNTPYDEMVRKIITASGSLDEYGLAAYVFTIQKEAGRETPQALAGRFSRVFLGTQIQCAQCHDHPFDKWTQEEFYGMASFMTEVSVSRKGGDKKAPYVIEDKVRRGRGGDIAIPDSKGGPVKASFITNSKGVEADVVRRVTFAKYMTEPDNMQFARAAVNRYWGHFFGRGIVNPVDDFMGRNKPSHPELLEELARDFIAHKYDLRWLIRSIVSADAYQLSSRIRKRDDSNDKYFAVSQIRALTPEQIMNAVFEATGAGERVGKALDKEKLAQLRERILRQFRYAFGDDEGADLLEFAGTIPQALLLMNGDIVSAALETSAGGKGDRKKGDRRMQGGGNRLSKILADHAGADERVRAIYLTVLSRTPTPTELSRSVSYVKSHGGDSDAFEDVMWALLNSSEFLLNH